MHPSGNLFEPNFRGASPAGRQLGFDGNHAGPQSKNSQLFLPDHFFGHAQSTQPSTSESTGTTSSQYSVPLRNPNFENYMATSTSTSSLESGWSNVQTDSALVSIEQYRSLQARFNEMQREHSNLIKQCELLSVKNSTLKEAYEFLVARVPTSFSEHVVLKREDYAKISYWFRHEYLAALAEGRITSIDDAPVKAQGADHNEADDDDDAEDGIGVREQPNGAPKAKRGKGRASQGENVKMRYIQHENGDVIDGWRATEIRRYARSIFVGFAMDGKVFPSWVEGADVTSRNNYCRHMVTRFPELGFCDLDWKSEQIASEIYSQWRTHWISKQETEKSKGKSSSKRLLEENSKDDPSHKKTKVTKVSESMSKSVPVSLDLSPVDFSDSVPQINIITDTPARPAPAMGQAATGNQSLVDPTLLTGSDARPEYLFSLNKPFSVAPLQSAAPSSLTLANAVHSTQGSSNADQHDFGAFPSQGVQELPQENTQKASRRPNKMRVNKHSTTPRNLCAKEWVEQHHGTVEDFATYFSALPPEELERFKALSKSLTSKQAA